MTLLANLTAAHARLSHNVRGALWMLASAFTFTAMTTLIKYLGDDYSPALQAFYRQAIALVLIAPIILRNPAAAFKINRPGLLLYRALAVNVGTIFAFYSYQTLPLAEANAISFTRTLWVVPLAMFVLHEKIGAWRIGATITGFIGVLVMLQPAVESELGWPAAGALLSAAVFATTVTGLKLMSRDNSILSLTTWSTLLGVLIALPLAIVEWHWPNLRDFLLLAAMGAFALANQFFFTNGMATGDAAAMAPIDYTRLIFAVAMGFFLFHEVPNWLTMLGAAIIIVSTLIITLRETRLKQAPPPPDQ